MFFQSGGGSLVFRFYRLFFLNNSKLKHFQHARATWGAVGHGALYHSQVHFCNYAYCSYSGQLVYYLDAEFYPFPRGIFWNMYLIFCFSCQVIGSVKKKPSCPRWVGCLICRCRLVIMPKNAWRCTSCSYRSTCWKCNFPMTPHVRRSAGWLVGHNFLKGRKLLDSHVSESRILLRPDAWPQGCHTA